MKESTESGDHRMPVSEAVNEAPVDELMRDVEALLMAADSPLSIKNFVDLLKGQRGVVEIASVQTALDALQVAYRESAVDLVEVATGWRFQVGADYSALVAGLWEEKPPRLSRALLETLAIICYRQPVTRSDIEQVRGVSVSSGIIRTLTDYDWIKVIGHREIPGRPALFATTRRFLDDFGVRQLSDLPSLPEVRDGGDALEAALARLQLDGGQTGPDTEEAS